MPNTAENLDNYPGDFNDRSQALEAARKQELNPGNFRVPQNGRADKHADQHGDEDENSNGEDRSANERKRTSVGEELDSVRNLAKSATPMGAVSLLGQIHFLGDLPYAAALGAAILKDGLDLVFIGSLPGLGTVITICCSIFIAMMMMLVGSGGKKKAASGIFKKMGVLIGGTLAEGILPGINFLPMETVMVVSIYVMTLSERKNSGN